MLTADQKDENWAAMMAASMALQMVGYLVQKKGEKRAALTALPKAAC